MAGARLKYNHKMRWQPKARRRGKNDWIKTWQK